MVKFFKAAALASLLALTHAVDQYDYKLDQKGQIQVGDAKCLNTKFAEVDCSKKKTTFHLVHGMLCDEKDVKCLQPTKGKKYKLKKLGNEIEGSMCINNDNGFIEHKIDEKIKCITVTDGKIHSTACSDGNISVPDTRLGTWKAGNKCLSSKKVNKDKTLAIKPVPCKDKFCDDKHCSWKLENGIMKTTDGKRCVINSKGVLKTALCTSAKSAKFEDDAGVMHPISDSKQCLISKGKKVILGLCTNTKFKWVQETVATTAEPTSAEPTTAEPTTAEPTTVKPTTAEPTTTKPTTAEPITVKPTTAEPTTAEPTTVKSTTAEPTTAEPTTVKSTTVKLTTAEPTTAEPTTSTELTSNVVKNKIYKTLPSLPVRWSLSFTITLLGIGTRSQHRNIVHVNKTENKSIENQKSYHMFPKISFMNGTDYDLKIQTSNCFETVIHSLYKTGWATGEKHIVALKNRNVYNTVKPFVDKTYLDLWIDNKLVATYKDHKFCNKTGENGVVYTSGNFNDAANVILEDVSYEALGDQPNIYPGKELKAFQQSKKNYKLNFTCKVLGRSTQGLNSLIYVGSEKERMPAVFWKKGTRYTMFTSHVKNEGKSYNLEFDTGVTNGSVFQYEFSCAYSSSKRSALVAMRAHSGEAWVIKKTGDCNEGWTNGRDLKIFASSPWHNPADVQISDVAYEEW